MLIVLGRANTFSSLHETLPLVIVQPADWRRLWLQAFASTTWHSEVTHAKQAPSYSDQSRSLQSGEDCVRRDLRMKDSLGDCDSRERTGHYLDLQSGGSGPSREPRNGSSYDDRETV